MKTTRIATLKSADLHNKFKGYTSYIFKEILENDNDTGFIYQLIINGEIKCTVKSDAFAHEYNELVADARKTIYQKQLRGVGMFDVEIISNLKMNRETRKFE